MARTIRTGGLSGRALHMPVRPCVRARSRIEGQATAGQRDGAWVCARGGVGRKAFGQVDKGTENEGPDRDAKNDAGPERRVWQTMRKRGKAMEGVDVCACEYVRRGAAMRHGREMVRTEARDAGMFRCELP